MTVKRRDRIQDALNGEERRPFQVNHFPVKLRQTFVSIARMQGKTAGQLLEDMIYDYVKEFIEKNTISKI